MCWGIWGERCKAIMEEDVQSRYPKKTCKQAIEAMVVTRQRVGVRVSHPSVQTILDAGWLKFNVDADLLGEVRTSVGVVGGNKMGELLCSQEYPGIHGWRRPKPSMKVCWRPETKVSRKLCWPESDSLQVVQALKQQSSGSSDFHLVLEDIFALVSCFESVIWSFLREREIELPML